MQKKSLCYLINLDGKYITNNRFDKILKSELEGTVASGYIGEDIYDIAKNGEGTLSK